MFQAGQWLKTMLAELQPIFPRELWPMIWLTGGTVRDALLGKPGKDLDLAAAVPSATLRSLGYRLVVGRSTEPVWLRHDSIRGSVEVTQLDSPDEILDDLKRRDFTMNAIALSLAGELIDPLGGREDLESGLLQPCSGQAFIDDPLRIFRAFRFAAEGFSFSAATEELLKGEGWHSRLAGIPMERFSREMLKALAAPQPERFFNLMVRHGAGRIFLPELFRMAEVPAGPAERHPEGDLLSHSIDILKQVSALTADPLSRFCALFHDIGKLATDRTLYPTHQGHEEAGFAAALDFCSRLKLSSAQGRALAWVNRLHGKANRLGVLPLSTGIILAMQAEKGGVSDILPLVSSADSPGGMDPAYWRRLLAVARMTTPQLGIAEKELLGIPAESRSDYILQKRVEHLRRCG